jgi:aryl-alcohol dehydrogenase-like predicted oxidoreductase
MQYLNLGNSGLKVSKLCLGCMTYGISDRGNHSWTLNEEESRPFIQKALELGISEEIVGKALRDFASREEVVLATKVHGRMRPGPNGQGLSRKVIFAEIDASLKRLGTDYVDLYQIHRFDASTPLEETLEALHDVVKAGKARYIGASSMYAWQFAKSLFVADLNGWTRFISMQNHYNLLYREEEREMMGLCVDQGIGVIPWSPLARGRLTRAWDESTERGETDEFGKTLYTAGDREIVEQVAAVAEKRGVPKAQVALAWMLSKAYVTSPIIGASKPHHLDDAVAALEVQLTDEEIAQLEENYQPHRVAGFS